VATADSASVQVLWASWTDVNRSPGTIFNYGVIQGPGQHDNKLWSATVLSVSGEETSISAASF